MEKQIFRKASMEKVSSQEQLNDYIRVSNPSVWMILAAVITLLIGVCVWGIFGHLDTKIATAGTCENGVFTCYVTDEKARQIKSKMTINVDGVSFTVTGIATKPVAVTTEMDSYLRYLGGFSQGEWLYEITADATLPDGTYQAQIVTESVAPMSFILN